MRDSTGGGGVLTSSSASGGVRYTVSQTASQAKPVSPTARNADCQPMRSTNHATSGGATIAPMAEPLLKMPEASARSFGGNHSETTFIAAGQLPASPNPSRKRKAPSDHADRAIECIAPAADHKNMQAA